MLADGVLVSAAGRALGMSYRRTWLLVDAMNRCWKEPLVGTTPGNPKAGAHLTALGEGLLARYRELQDDVEQVGTEWHGTIAHDLLPAPLPQRRTGGPDADAL